MGQMPYLWLVIIVVAVIILDWLLIHRASKRWYQHKMVQNRTGEVRRILGSPSPVLTGLEAWYHSFAVTRSGWFMTGWNGISPTWMRLAPAWIELKTRLGIVMRSLAALWGSFSWLVSRLPSILSEKRLQSNANSISEPVHRKGLAPNFWGTALEIGLIGIWGLFISRSYFSSTSISMPIGGEFGSLIQSHFIWQWLPRCGACVMWNGQIDGGAPAFVELSGAVLHPLVIFTTLVWGVINGSKMLVVLSLMMAGLAQWWLARILKLGRITRLWSALLVMIGGHLVGKLDNGNVNLVLSLASASLILPAAVDLFWNGNRRAVVWLAGALALTALAGEGYIQLAALLALLPPMLILLLDQQCHIRPAWKHALIALGLAVLLAGIFLVPLAHFLPNFDKDGDAGFSNFQPLAYIPLNLVISDRDFLTTNILGKDGNIYTHVLYIGWIPVLLALSSIGLLRNSTRRLLAFLGVSIGLVFLICSAEFIQAMARILPSVEKLRHLSSASALAVPYIIALAGLGLDRLLKVAFPRLKLALTSNRQIELPLVGSVCIVLLFLSLQSTYNFSHGWLNVSQPFYVPGASTALPTTSAEWVSPPTGAYPWHPVLLGQGLKLTEIWRPWFWRDHPFPPAYLKVSDSPDSASKTPILAQYDPFFILHAPTSDYAYIDTGSHQYACAARSQAGNIDLTCDSPGPGTLVVRENWWHGWTAWVDQQPVNLKSYQWLAVDAPAGTHTYRFRYLPWDVPLGLALTLAGFIFSIWWLVKRPAPV